MQPPVHKQKRVLTFCLPTLNKVWQRFCGGGKKKTLFFFHFKLSKSSEFCHQVLLEKLSEASICLRAVQKQQPSANILTGL